jgi:hypothetical protein
MSWTMYQCLDAIEHKRVDFESDVGGEAEK